MLPWGYPFKKAHNRKRWREKEDKERKKKNKRTGICTLYIWEIRPFIYSPLYADFWRAIPEPLGSAAPQLQFPSLALPPFVFLSSGLLLFLFLAFSRCARVLSCCCLAWHLVSFLGPILRALSRAFFSSSLVFHFTFLCSRLFLLPFPSLTLLLC